MEEHCVGTKSVCINKATHKVTVGGKHVGSVCTSCMPYLQHMLHTYYYNVAVLPIAPTVEERLAAVEAKLDLVLKKLEDQK